MITRGSYHTAVPSHAAATAGSDSLKLSHYPTAGGVERSAIASANASSTESLLRRFASAWFGCRESLTAAPFGDRLVPKYERGRWYYVEAHLANFGIYGPAALGVVHETAEHVEFLSLLVNDSVRGRGLGKQVVCAIRERWPTATWTDTPDSRPFHETLVRDGIARITDERGYSHSYVFATVVV